MKTADLIDGLEIYDASELNFEPEEPDVLRVTAKGKPAVPKAIEKQSSVWRNATEELAEGTRRGRSLTTATEAVKAEKQADEKPVPAAAPGSDEGASFGTLVHDLFELIDWEKPEDIESLAEDEAAGLDLSEDRAEEATQMVLESLKSETMKRIIKSDAYYKELPFAVREGSTSLEGKIDVLFLEKGDIYVLDFKTDRVSGKDIKARAEHYRPQAEAYARAVEATCGRPPREVIFFFLRPMEPVRIN
jgi:ATP-dependent exoDNAse (exonuclease V) beta subunit